MPVHSLAQTGLLINSEGCRNITFGYLEYHTRCTVEFTLFVCRDGAAACDSTKNRKATRQVTVGKVFIVDDLLVFRCFKKTLIHTSLGGNGV